MLLLPIYFVAAPPLLPQSDSDYDVDASPTKLGLQRCLEGTLRVQLGRLHGVDLAVRAVLT
jgi:hypothetical protein